MIYIQNIHWHVAKLLVQSYATFKSSSTKKIVMNLCVYCLWKSHKNLHKINAPCNPFFVFFFSIVFVLITQGTLTHVSLVTGRRKLFPMLKDWQKEQAIKHWIGKYHKTTGTQVVVHLAETKKLWKWRHGKIFFSQQVCSSASSDMEKPKIIDEMCNIPTFQVFMLNIH